MSERNGDKSRFGRMRKQKLLRRKRNQTLRERLGLALRSRDTPPLRNERISGNRV
jgi:hypothetical protein